MSAPFRPKFTQISVATDENTDSVYALSEDGEVYRYCPARSSGDDGDYPAFWSPLSGFVASSRREAQAIARAEGGQS